MADAAAAAAAVALEAGLALPSVGEMTTKSRTRSELLLLRSTYRYGTGYECRQSKKKKKREASHILSRSIVMTNVHSMYKMMLL